jgi:hypothetical protein
MTTLSALHGVGARQVQSVLEGLRAAELRPILPEGAQGWQSCGDLAQETRVADPAPSFQRFKFRARKGGVRRPRADQATEGLIGILARQRCGKFGPFASVSITSTVVPARRQSRQAGAPHRASFRFRFI